MPTPYTNVFGGSAVNQAEPSFRLVTLTADVTLVWPRFNYSDPNSAADILEVNATSSGLSINLPDAQLASPGTPILFYNIGAHSFDVNVNSGGSGIATVPPSEAIYVWVKDNTTADGQWSAVQFAVGSSAVIAAALAGAGLQAISGLLTTAWPTVTASVSPLNISATTHRSALVNWTGGVATFNLPAGAGIEQFFFSVKNSGSGSITIDCNGADTIDGGVTKQVGVGESFIIVCDGAEWFTIGNRLIFTATYIEIDVAGSGTYVLPVNEQGYLIYKFIGVLTGNRAIQWPAAVNQMYVHNATTGTYTLSIGTTAPGGLAPTVGQSDQVVAYSDGTNVFILQENTQLDDGTIGLIAQFFG